LQAVEPEDEVLLDAELAALEDALEDELLALLEEALEVLLEELLEVLAGPTEHQAESVKALPPVKSDREQVKLPVSVA